MEHLLAYLVCPPLMAPRGTGRYYLFLCLPRYLYSTGFTPQLLVSPHWVARFCRSSAESTTTVISPLTSVYAFWSKFAVVFDAYYFAAPPASWSSYRGANSSELTFLRVQPMKSSRFTPAGPLQLVSIKGIRSRINLWSVSAAYSSPTALIAFLAWRSHRM